MWLPWSWISLFTSDWLNRLIDSLTDYGNRMHCCIHDWIHQRHGHSPLPFDDLIHFKSNALSHWWLSSLSNPLLMLSWWTIPPPPIPHSIDNQINSWYMRRDDDPTNRITCHNDNWNFQLLAMINSATRASHLTNQFLCPVEWHYGIARYDIILQ